MGKRKGILGESSVVVKHITVKVYEEIKTSHDFHHAMLIDSSAVEWIDNQGINTPYLITYK